MKILKLTNKDIEIIRNSQDRYIDAIETLLEKRGKCSFTYYNQVECENLKFQKILNDLLKCYTKIYNDLYKEDKANFEDMKEYDPHYKKNENLYGGAFKNEEDFNLWKNGKL